MPELNITSEQPEKSSGFKKHHQQQAWRPEHITTCDKHQLKTKTDKPTQTSRSNMDTSNQLILSRQHTRVKLKCATSSKKKTIKNLIQPFFQDLQQRSQTHCRSEAITKVYFITSGLNWLNRAINTFISKI